MSTNDVLRTSLQLLVDTCHGVANQRGWHEFPREKGTLLALIHSEISEALEHERKGTMDDHLPHRRGAEVELADAVIRIADYCGKFEYDLAGAILEKLAYNVKRQDHNREVRAAEGGKKF